MLRYRIAQITALLLIFVNLMIIFNVVPNSFEQGLWPGIGSIFMILSITIFTAFIIHKAKEVRHKWIKNVVHNFAKYLYSYSMDTEPEMKRATNDLLRVVGIKQDVTCIDAINIHALNAKAFHFESGNQQKPRNFLNGVFKLSSSCNSQEDFQQHLVNKLL